MPQVPRVVAPKAAIHFDPHGGTNDHFWIVMVVFQPDYDPQDHAWIVNLTSTVVDGVITLEKGDHPYVHHTSYVWYDQAFFVSAADILAADATWYEPVSDEIFEKLYKGSQDTKYISKRAKREIREHRP